jgi:hypothetical protein
MFDLIQFSIENEKIIRYYKTAYTPSKPEAHLTFLSSIKYPDPKKNPFLTENQHLSILKYINSFTTECDIPLYNVAIFQSIYDLTCFNYLAYRV